MILQRIKEYIDLKGVSVSAFEKSIGMSNASFGRSLKNNGAIGTDKLENILIAHRDINPVWLLTGEGNMIIDSRKTIPSLATKREGIPLISYSSILEVFTGKQLSVSSEVKYFVLPSFKDADFLLTVADNTMTPHYKAGDIIVCKRLPSKGLFFQWNKIYLLTTTQYPLIKRIHEGKDKEHLLLISDNTEYPPFQLHYSQISNVALVLGSISGE